MSARGDSFEASQTNLLTGDARLEVEFLRRLVKPA